MMTTSLRLISNLSRISTRSLITSFPSSKRILAQSNTKSIHLSACRFQAPSISFTPREPPSAAKSSPSSSPHSVSSSTYTGQGEVPKSLPIWLYGTSFLIFGIVVVGGLTRLTESGLSITEWKPILGALPPMSDHDWAVEFVKYQNSPEAQALNPNMTLSEFKTIYFWEWSHRNLGRVIGLVFVIPAAYYVRKYKLPKSLKIRLGIMTLLIGAQGALGWFMVKSGLEDGQTRVSQYRLAAHLSTALLLYIGTFSTAYQLRREEAYRRGEMGRAQIYNHAMSAKPLKSFKKYLHGVGGLIALTIISGAFVAGLDAGMIYNNFPYMGEHILPPTSEMYSNSINGGYIRNSFENPVTAQLNHRILGVTTWLATLGAYAFSRMDDFVRLPDATIKWTGAMFAAASLQAALGIATLYYEVPIALAAAHQANSVALLTTFILASGSLMKPKSLIRQLSIMRSMSNAQPQMQIMRTLEEAASQVDGQAKSIVASELTMDEKKRRLSRLVFDTELTGWSQKQ